MYSNSGNLTPRTVALHNDHDYHDHLLQTDKVTEQIDRAHSTTSSKAFRLSVVSEGDGTSPLYSAIFNMLAGCGIVGLPVTYKNSGLVVGVVLMVFVAFISVYTLRLLVKTGKYVNVEDYERLTERCFGMTGYYFLAITILLFDIGACMTYSIILGDSAHAVMKHLFGWNSETDRILVVVGAYVVLILPFCLGKSHDFIEKISACAIAAVVIMIGVVTFQYFHKWSHRDVEGIKLFNNNSQQLLSALGTISFAFVQHDQTFLVYKTLYNNTLKRYTILASWALAIQSVLCICIGVFGYLSFGSNTQDDVLQNYDIDDWLIIAIRIMYTLTMAFIFPTAFYVVRHIAYGLLNFKSEETFAQAPTWKRIPFTLLCWAFFLALAILVTDLGFVMSLSGLICAIIIAFILPCACNIKCSPHPWLFWNAPRGQKWDAFCDIVPSIFLIIFGMAAGGVGTVQLFMTQFN